MAAKISRYTVYPLAQVCNATTSNYKAALNSKVGVIAVMYCHCVCGLCNQEVTSSLVCI